MSAEPDPHRARQLLAITCGATFMAFLGATIVKGEDRSLSPVSECSTG